MMSTVEPPPGFELRVATVDDAGLLAELINEVNLAEVGFPWTTADEVRGDLTAPDRDPPHDVLLFDASGTLVGYLTLSMDEDEDADGVTTANALAWVRPSMWGRGVSSLLLASGERQIEREASGAARHLVVIHLACWSSNDAAKRLFAGLGYGHVRTFLQMRRELDEPTEPTEPTTPAGIVIRAFNAENDAQKTHAALAEAFGDHWGRAFDPFERWRHDHIDGPAAGSDLGLWFVALDGDVVVGASCSRPEMESSPDTASVDFLAVRRPWRERGVARALLLSTFDAARRRGIAAVELGVDASNPTGATRLYEGVGMRVVRSFEIWEKKLALEPSATS
jgi:mycothiol synthase